MVFYKLIKKSVLEVFLFLVFFIYLTILNLNYSVIL